MKTKDWMGLGFGLALLLGAVWFIAVEAATLVVTIWAPATPDALRQPPLLVGVITAFLYLTALRLLFRKR